MISLFEDQRMRSQFAVLFLSPHQDINKDNTQFEIRELGKVHEPDHSEATDWRSATFPPDNKLGNYITARPGKHHHHHCEHAEALLLDRFDYLRDKSGEACESIVLYTWFLPCEHCTEKIIDTLGLYTSNYQVTVVYTVVMNGLKETEKENIDKLERADITVMQEDYDVYLHPKKRKTPHVLLGPS